MLSPGCPHRVSSAELYCVKCDDYYGCRYCHDEEELGHDLDV